MADKREQIQKMMHGSAEKAPPAVAKALRMTAPVVGFIV